jgi:hypothetical protein
MTVYDEQLFLGTFDWTSVAASAILDLIPQSMSYMKSDQSINEAIKYPLAQVGADLYRFEDPDSPAVGETLGGFGNWSNYGVRSMIADDNLYVGTGNPFNLRVGEADGTDGGWELIQLGKGKRTPIPTVPAVGLALVALLLITVGFVMRRRLGSPN